MKYVRWNSNSENNVTKKTIVLVHGFADYADMFEPMTTFMHDFDLISINLPMNQGNDKYYSIQELSDYIIEIVDSLEIKSYVLVGFSLGGMISIEVAKNDEGVSKLVLLNSFPILIPSNKLKSMLEKLSKHLKNRKTLFPMSRLNVNKVLRKLMIKHQLREQNMLNMKNNYYSVFGTLLNCIFNDYVEDYKRLEIPKMIFLCKDDEVLSYKIYSKFAKKYDLEITSLLCGGHDTKECYWERLEKDIKRFID